MYLFDRILLSRGLGKDSLADFLLPDYDKKHSPFLLPDMDKAIERLLTAHKKNEKITIYGDYDIDGLTATAVLLDAFAKFGYKNVKAVIPSRFVDGYGLTIDAVESVSASGESLIVTVDCGSLSESAIVRANELGVDVIVTDHHNAAEKQPPAIAVVNPKRADSKYPFTDLAGVGVAFKLVQALQTKLKGLPAGHEKWLLDLVALGTVCDIVPLVDENRVNVFWGLKVLSKTKRPGLKALLNVADVNPLKINVRTLGFSLGPRMNAAGRLDTAQYALDMLTSSDYNGALLEADRLNQMNIKRQTEQKKIVEEATIKAEKYSNQSVLVLSDPNWNNGIVGIVASKILEKYKKPNFILQEINDESRGSARSFGAFSVADAIKACKGIVTSGGGHKLAAGVSLPTKNINKFRIAINDYYDSLGLTGQHLLLLPKADAIAELEEVDEKVVELISQLEPFGNGNPQPILKTDNLTVKNMRRMGSDGQHVKLDLQSHSGKIMQFVAFNASDNLFTKAGSTVNVWYYPEINEWQGRRSVEGKLLHLEVATS